MRSIKKTAVWWLVAGVCLVAAYGCGDNLPVEEGMNIPPVQGGVEGTPYVDLVKLNDAGANADSGLDASTGPADGSIGDAQTDDASVSSDIGVEADGGYHPAECPANLFLTARAAGDIKLGQKVTGTIAADCDAARYSLILAAGQTVRVKTWGDRMYAALRSYGPGNRGFVVENVKRVIGAVAQIEFTPDIPGEYFIVVAQSARRGVSDYTVEVECVNSCDLKATRYPIILVHGFSGFNGLGPINYFYNVVDTFGPEGYDIRVAVLDPFNSSEKRGAQLAKVVDEVMASSHANKVNIIAHSQGGVDSRYVISGLSYGDRVGVLNTISTPHNGTAIADVYFEDPTIKTLFKVMFAAVGIVIEGPEAEHNLDASMLALSTATMLEFNKKYTNDNRVMYRSWAGKSCKSGCSNTIDFFLIPTYNAIYDRQGDNDGIVPSSSGVWGDFQGYLVADHFQEVGQLLGATGSFDYMQFYRNVIESSAALGY